MCDKNRGFLFSIIDNQGLNKSEKENLVDKMEDRNKNKFHCNRKNE